MAAYVVDANNVVQPLAALPDMGAESFTVYAAPYGERPPLRLISQDASSSPLGFAVTASGELSQLGQAYAASQFRVVPRLVISGKKGASLFERTQVRPQSVAAPTGVMLMAEGRMKFTRLLPASDLGQVSSRTRSRLRRAWRRTSAPFLAADRRATRQAAKHAAVAFPSDNLTDMVDQELEARESRSARLARSAADTVDNVTTATVLGAAGLAGAAEASQRVDGLISDDLHRDLFDPQIIEGIVQHRDVVAAMLNDAPGFGLALATDQAMKRLAPDHPQLRAVSTITAGVIGTLASQQNVVSTVLGTQQLEGLAGGAMTTLTYAGVAALAARSSRQVQAAQIADQIAGKALANTTVYYCERFFADGQQRGYAKDNLRRMAFEVTGADAPSAVYEELDRRVTAQLARRDGAARLAYREAVDLEVAAALSDMGVPVPVRSPTPFPAAARPVAGPVVSNRQRRRAELAGRVLTSAASTRTSR